ncbi:MAG: cell wall metabolism sensor histidine kinase WalK, partial [Actinobacteria bacterium]
MHREGAPLTALVNDFLDIQRMASGTARAGGDRSPLSPRAGARRRGKSAEHTLILEGPERLPPVEADADRVRQVMANLISNARKYSPAGGEIRISVRLLEGAAEVSVTDQGLGLPPEALHR